MSKLASVKEIGRRIREAREAAGLTGEGLAEKIRSDKGTISRIERGLVRLDVIRLQRIAAVLGLEASDLLAPQPRLEHEPV